MYDDTISSSNTTTSTTNLYDSTFFFRTSDNRVYKVLDNNGGTAYSGSEPTSESTSPFASGGYILKYMYKITASEQTKFLTTDFMPVSTDSTVSAAATDGKIESLVVTGGSGYTNGTYYAAVYGDGANAGTSSGAVIRITVASNTIQSFGLTAGTDTTINSGGSGYTFGTVNLGSGFTFSDAHCRLPLQWVALVVLFVLSLVRKKDMVMMQLRTRWTLCHDEYIVYWCRA